MGQIDSLRSQKFASKSQKKGEKLGKEALLEGAQSKLRTINLNVADTTTLKSSAVDLLATVTANYSRRIEEANKTVEALKSCLQILSEGKEKLAASESVASQALQQAKWPDHKTNIIYNLI